MSATTPESSDSIFTTNPYTSVSHLSQSEAAVLWEYAKLARQLKLVIQKTNDLSEQPDKLLLGRLRILEKKMGLVLTMFRASVWGVINEQNINVSVENAGTSMDATRQDDTIQQD